jgi:type VI secretion system secreted protein Hcp
MAFDAFLHIDGIKGESLDDKHKDQIEVDSYGFSLTQSGRGVGTAGGHATGRVDFGDFYVSKALDAASPNLYLACANGTVHKSAILTLCRAGGDKLEYMKIELKDVMIKSVQPSGNGQGDVPTETVNFAYGWMGWTYTQQDPTTGKAKGNVAAAWDLKANKKA